MSGKKLQVNTGGEKTAEVDKSKIAEYVFKFVLGLVVSCGKIVGGLSPFGVAFTAACGTGAVSYTHLPALCRKGLRTGKD